MGAAPSLHSWAADHPAWACITQTTSQGAGAHACPGLLRGARTPCLATEMCWRVPCRTWFGGMISRGRRGPTAGTPHRWHCAIAMRARCLIGIAASRSNKRPGQARDHSAPVVPLRWARREPDRRHVCLCYFSNLKRARPDDRAARARRLDPTATRAAPFARARGGPAPPEPAPACAPPPHDRDDDRRRTTCTTGHTYTHSTASTEHGAPDAQPRATTTLPTITTRTQIRASSTLHAHSPMCVKVALYACGGPLDSNRKSAPSQPEAPSAPRAIAHGVARHRHSAPYARVRSKPHPSFAMPSRCPSICPRQPPVC